ncbi:MAG TPA: DUF2157 domain-containing protein, partial [Aquihabitans sp.]|nr:DUF2157 domain-containing protein [Aquihabitans sp.]
MTTHHASPPSPPSPPGPGLSVQNLLLASGTGLVAVAAIVFTAVNWGRMGAAAQGGLLLALTLSAAAATLAAARRRMPATAEAVGLVALLLALADAHALRVAVDVELGATWWAGALVVLSAGAWALGEATAVRSTRLAAAALGQLALPLLLAGTGADPTPAGAVLLAQVALVATASERGTRVHR